MVLRFWTYRKRVGIRIGLVSDIVLPSIRFSANMTRSFRIPRTLDNPMAIPGPPTDHRVYAVRSLQEARRILHSSERFHAKNLMLRIFISCWVFAANLCLLVLRLLLFKKRGCTVRKFKSIVVYTVGIVGDNLVMLPALAALRRRYPEATITVITNCQEWDQQGAIGVLGPSPFKDRLIFLDDHPVNRRGHRLLMDADKFEGIHCELFVNLSPFGNRGWIGAVLREMIFAKKLGAEYAVGFRMSTYSRRGIFNEVQYRFVRNEPRRSRQVLQELGLRPIERVDLLAKDSLARKTVLKKLRELDGDTRRLFVLNPGAKFQSKCWPPEYFGELASCLVHRYHASVVVTGTPEERKVCDEVVKASGGTAFNLAGQTTIQELVELLRTAKGCITNDTGTMHVSAMIGIPTVAIFSARHSPTHWFPLGDRVVALFSVLHCIYCYNDYCETKACLNRIELDHVLQAFESVMDAAKIRTPVAEAVDSTG